MASAQFSKLEQQAGQIADPIQRLRFLRQETSKLSWWKRITRFAGPRLQSIHLRHWLHAAAWGAAAVALVMVPGPRPSGTAATLRREKGLLIPGQAQASDNGAAQIDADIPRVWRVENAQLTEVYSNGLRIDDTFTISNRPRLRFPIFPLNGASKALSNGSEPVGIVFHTTETLLAPFEEDQNRRLQQIGRNLLEVIRKEQAYHYVIDRFGRVYRVVREQDAANHAGKSVWADSTGIYVNLNDSFLAVAFETQTDVGATTVTPAQIQSGRMLVEMLRSKYRISAEDCVTHAQVSVNPQNMRIGDHTDWAGNFPFASLGLPVNYAIAPASLYAFGFEYDDAFLHATGGGWKGLEAADDQVRRQATAESVTVAQYRAILRHRYKDISTFLEALHSSANSNPNLDNSEGGN